MRFSIAKYVDKNSQRLVFDVLFFISLAGTTFLFWNFSDIPLYRIYWIITGIGAVEFFRIHILAVWKKAVRHIKNIDEGQWFKTKFRKALGHTKYLPILIIYLLLAGVSVVATISVAINTIEMQSAKVSNTADAVRMRDIEFRREQIKIQLDNYTREQGDLGFSVAERIGLFNEDIDKLNREFNELGQELGTLMQNQEFVPDSIFASLADKLLDFRVQTTGDSILLLLMIMMALAIEFGIIFTSEAQHEELSLKESRYKVFAFIDALMDIGDGKVRLNGEKVIMEKTGFDSDTVKQYKELLMQMKYNGKPLLYQDGKVIKANFSTANMKRIVETKANLE